MDNIKSSYPKQKASFMDTILRIVSRHTGISEQRMEMKTRKREVVVARQIAMILSRTFTDASLADVGYRIGGKDHATVMHACKTVNNLIETDKKFEARYLLIFEEISDKVSIMGDGKSVCLICGSPDIQVREWLYVNSGKQVLKEERIFAVDNWCPVCVSPTTIVPALEHIGYKEHMAKLEYENQLHNLEKELKL